MGVSTAGLPCPPPHPHPSARQPSDVLRCQSRCEQKSRHGSLSTGVLSPGPAGVCSLEPPSSPHRESSLLCAARAVPEPCCTGRGGRGGGQPGSLGTRCVSTQVLTAARRVGTRHISAASPSRDPGLAWQSLPGPPSPYKHHQGKPPSSLPPSLLS